MPDSGLTIVYASSFDFGSHPVSNKAEVYNAAAQKLDDNTTRTNYVQVADNRGTFSGWNLKVQMTDFTTADSNLVANGHGTLTGATVTLGDAEIQGAGTANPADISSAITVLTPGVQSTTILGATAGHGSGNSLLDFGGKDGAKKDTAIKLSVPAGVAGAAKYTADLTWTLDDTPSN
ncbi:Extracellular protein [Lactococcus cremoris subsp. cremoris A76]|nr:Extracellular protein [Lactococcus cremoris subsp. cremoris A76]